MTRTLISFLSLFVCTGIIAQQSIEYTETNSIDKPVHQKPIPSGVTAEGIFKDYIEAIGGSKAVSKVKTILTNAEVTIEGAPFKPNATIKSMAPNKTSMEMYMEGMGTIVKQKFDGKNGYVEQQGKKTEMDTEEIAEKQNKKGLFPEIYLEKEAIKLISLISINGTDAYKIEVSGKNDSFRYYDAENAILIRTEDIRYSQGQKLTQVSDYSDYKAVNGVMMPHTRTISAGPQIITFVSSEIKINEGVSKKDFK